MHGVPDNVTVCCTVRQPINPLSWHAWFAPAAVRLFGGAVTERWCETGDGFGCYLPWIDREEIGGKFVGNRVKINNFRSSTSKDCFINTAISKETTYYLNQN